MKKRIVVLFFALILMGATATGARAATILYDWAFILMAHFLKALEEMSLATLPV